MNSFSGSDLNVFDSNGNLILTVDGRRDARILRDQLGNLLRTVKPHRKRIQKGKLIAEYTPSLEAILRKSDMNFSTGRLMKT